jgi:hypothetical protein
MPAIPRYLACMANAVSGIDGISAAPLRHAGPRARGFRAPRPHAAGVLRLQWPGPAATIAGCLTFALVLFLPAILNDGDTLWQIATGGWIIGHHAIPATDPFSFTAGDRPWFAHEWLAETLLALAWRGGGMAGVMALAAAAAGLAASLLLHHLRRFLPPLYAVMVLVVAFANAAPSLLARPHLLAWPCLVAWCAGLATARARGTAPAWRLLPVMLLWVNLHGSFMLGLLLPGGFLLEALLAPGADRRQVLAGWGGFIAAAWAIALLNPDGPGGVLFPLHLVGMHGLAWIGEWQPADFSHLQPLELTLLALLALGLSGRLCLPPLRLLMLLGLVHGALAHARNGQLLGLVGAVILAEALGACLRRGHAADGVAGPAHAEPRAATALAAPAHAVLPAAAPSFAAPSFAVRAAASIAAKAPPTARRRLRAATMAAGGLAIAALGARFALPLPPARTGAAFAATLAQLPAALRAAPVLNAYELGGALIFNGVRPFIDSRADLYGDDFLARYHRIVAPDRAALETTLARYRIAWTIFPAADPVVALLDQEPGWHRLLTRDGVAVQVRDSVVPR